MSRTVNPYVSGGSAVNFGVTNRISRQANFVDQPLRSGVITASIITVSGTVQVSQVQSDMISISPPTGTIANTLVLPSAADLLQAFSNANVGTIIRLNIANKGIVTANFQGPTGAGMTATAGYKSVAVAPIGYNFANPAANFTGTVTQGVKTIHIEFDQVNGLSSNTGAPPVGSLSTGSYLVY